MTTSKHTPGPWIQEGDWVSDQDGNSIHRGLHTANARLIAAAPDLFFALHRCMIAFEKMGLSNCLAAEQARAAIAKAKGEA